MSKSILYHNGYFFEWESIVDGPTTPAMTREEMTAHLRRNEGLDGIIRLPERLDRAEKYGTSSQVRSDMRETVERNTMGQNGEALSFDDVIAVLMSAPEMTKEPDMDEVLRIGESYLAALDEIVNLQSNGQDVSVKTEVNASQAERRWKQIAPETIVGLIRDLRELRDEMENNYRNQAMLP